MNLFPRVAFHIFGDLVTMVICCREEASQTAARECLEETLGVIGNYDELHSLTTKDDVFKVKQLFIFLF